MAIFNSYVKLPEGMRSYAERHSCFLSWSPAAAPRFRPGRNPLANPTLQGGLPEISLKSQHILQLNVVQAIRHV
jgi:hypothetical protein